MFNRISTKNLYLLELSFIEKVEWYGLLRYKQYFSNQRRYILGKKISDKRYVDVFTKTEYKTNDDIYDSNRECITRSASVITTRKYITKDQATYILKELNPTYLPEQPKVLKKGKTL